MKSRTRHLLAAAVLVTAGLARLPVEQALTGRLQRENLLSSRLDIGVRETIGQTSSAVALGGLRTLVASFIHIGTADEFSNMDARALAESYETIVQLAPRVRYYWDLGAWHMGNNAPSWVRNDSELPPLRRRAEWRAWIAKSHDFLERGARNNPNDPLLWAALGNLYSNPFTLPDDEKAEAAYARAIATGIDRPHIFRAHLMALARTGKDPERTRRLLDELLRERTNRVPTLLGLRFVLESRLSPPADPLAFAVELFGGEDRAYRNLGQYFFNSPLDRMPVDGIEAALRLMEKRRGIAPDSPESYIRQREDVLNREDSFFGPFPVSLDTR